MRLSRCTECGSEDLAETSAPDTLVVAGRTFTADLPATRCQRCGATLLEGPAIADFERAVARELAQWSPHTGETVRFIRKALGLKAVDLAEMLNVTPETLARWETGELPTTRTSG